MRLLCIGYVKPSNDAGLKCIVGAHLLPLKFWDVLWLTAAGRTVVAFVAFLL